jgi:hypothetical protein
MVVWGGRSYFLSSSLSSIRRGIKEHCPKLGSTIFNGATSRNIHARSWNLELVDLEKSL